MKHFFVYIISYFNLLNLFLKNKLLHFINKHKTSKTKKCKKNEKH